MVRGRAVILFSFVGPLLYHTDQVNPNLVEVNLRARRAAIRSAPITSGFDILGRLMEGGQSSIEVGLAVGLIATRVRTDVRRRRPGYFGGAVDAVMMRVVDVGLAIPVVFLFIFMAQVYKPTLAAADRAAGAGLVADPGAPGPRRDPQPANP